MRSLTRPSQCLQSNSSWQYTSVMREALRETDETEGLILRSCRHLKGCHAAAEHLLSKHSSCQHAPKSKT